MPTEGLFEACRQDGYAILFDPFYPALQFGNIQSRYPFFSRPVVTHQTNARGWIHEGLAKSIIQNLSEEWAVAKDFKRVVRNVIR